MYMYSVYKEFPRYKLSIEIKDHKFGDLYEHLYVYNHHSSKSGHIDRFDTLQWTTQITVHNLASH